MATVLELDNLQITYHSAAGAARAVDGISFRIEDGEYLGLVGESGCGKSTIAKAILGILPANGAVTGGAMRYRGRDLVGISASALRQLRWRDIALVPQSAMNGFDPVYTVERQLDEAITAHASISPAERLKRVQELFAMVGLEGSRLKDYPHQFSGGMRQRAMIAMAMVLDPTLVVADEPTTGLDVIVQDQIMARIKEIHAMLKKTMLLITHDMAVVAENCDKIVVMYAGKVMEYGARTVFQRPYHPYTMGLCSAFPDLDEEDRPLISIPGSPPGLLVPPPGCRFAERCPFSTARCKAEAPALLEVEPGHFTACHYPGRAAEFRQLSRDPSVWRRLEAAALSQLLPA